MSSNPQVPNPQQTNPNPTQQNPQQTNPNPPANQNPTVQQTPEQIAAANAASQRTANPGNPPTQSVTQQPQANSGASASNPVIIQQTPESNVYDIGDGNFRVEYATGEKFEGTAAQVLANTANAHVNTKKWAQGIRDAVNPNPQNQLPQVFANDAERATAEYFSELTAKSLGYQNAAQMKSALGQIQQTTTDTYNQNLTLAFSAAQPDFNQTPENADKLLKTINEMGLEPYFDAAYNSGDRNGVVRLMQTAHAEALRRNYYQPRPANQQVVTSSNQQQPPPIPTGQAQQDYNAGLPDELKVDINTPASEIRKRHEEAVRRGLIQQ